VVSTIAETAATTVIVEAKSVRVGGDMRSNGSGGSATVVIVGVVFAFAVLFACAISFKGVAIHSIDTYATSEARPPSVAERAEAIRQETRLDNPQGIPTGFWVMGFIILLVVIWMFQGERINAAIADRKKQQRLLEKKNKRHMPAPSPYHVVDQQQFPELPQLPQRPQLPRSSSWPQLPGGESDV
jgi:Na+-transporting methylmalonyl-CoA/oxaloacetate decarboxylase gamma subunit